MKTALVLFFVLLLGQTCLPLASQHVQSNAASKEDLQTGRPCLFDRERGEVADCIHQSADGQKFIAPKYLPELSFDAHNLATVFSPDEGWLYVNREGGVIISGVPTMDNGADRFHDGLVRIVKNNRYGFASRKGQIVVPATYDGALNFEKGIAEVCMGCQPECVSDCEYHTFAGGEWFQINTRGTILKSGRKR